jgi:hypothetical protein
MFVFDISNSFFAEFKGSSLDSLDLDRKLEAFYLGKKFLTLVDFLKQFGNYRWLKLNAIRCICDID